MGRRKRDAAEFRKNRLKDLLEKADTLTHQKDFGVRVIITLKLAKGTLLLLAGFAALALIGENLGALVRQLAEALYVDPHGRYAEWLVSKTAGIDQKTLTLVGLGSFFYSAVMYTEAVGLHYRYTWAATLTIVATSLLIPVEVYEVIEHLSVLKVLILCINVAMVFYLYSHRSLFHPTHLGEKLKDTLQHKREARFNARRAREAAKRRA